LILQKQKNKLLTDVGWLLWKFKQNRYPKKLVLFEFEDFASRWP